jgi:hypothetical protein
LEIGYTANWAEVLCHGNRVMAIFSQLAEKIKVNGQFYSLFAIYYQKASWRWLVRISAGISAILADFFLWFSSVPQAGAEYCLV